MTMAPFTKSKYVIPFRSLAERVLDLTVRTQIPKYPILFIHVPKTAGTSFRVSLIKSMGKSRLCFDYRGVSQLLSAEVRAFMIDTESPVKFRRAFDKKAYYALSGHFDASRYSAAFAPENVIAFVRDPLEFVYSAYRHAKRADKTDLTFEEYVADTRNQNRQSRLLACECWPSFGLVGVTERFSDSLNVVNSHFGLNLRERTLNVASQKKGGKSELFSQRGWSEEFVNYFQSINSTDIQLYESVNTFLDKRIETIASGSPFVRGGFRVNNKQELFGKVAVDSLPRGAHQLEVLILGESVIKDSISFENSTLAERSFSYDLNAVVGSKPTASFSQEDIEVRLFWSDGVSSLTRY